ncbi:MAG: diguanylate cyclase domain-containing protein [Comamonas sp.]
MNASLTQGLDFEDLFELAPVSLWMEDYSKFKQVLDGWRAEGVIDLLAFLREAPERLQCFRDCFQIIRVNQFTLDLYRAPDQATLLSRLDEVLRDDITHNLEDELLALWEGKLSYAKPAVNYDLQGHKLYVRVNVRILPGYENDWSRVLVSLKDETAERQSRLQLQHSEQYARDLFTQSPVSLWVQDFSQVKQMLQALRDEGVQDFPAYLKANPIFVTRCVQAIRIQDVNQQTLHMFDAHSLTELQQHMLHIVGPGIYQHMALQLIDLWDGKLVQKREVVKFSLNSNKLYLHLEFAVLDSVAKDWSHVLVSLIDMTERKKTEAYLQYLSQHDVLTQLHNRAFYLETLERITQDGPWPLSLIAIDMNGLKDINDTQGHTAGDAQLVRIGKVLNATVEPPACAARIGGDEFMVLLPGMDSCAAHAMHIRILQALERNNEQHPDSPIHLAMGIASCTASESIDACINRADKAMYREKLRFYQALGPQRYGSPAQAFLST